MSIYYHYFKLGFVMAIQDRSELVTTTLIYAVLMTVFHTIFSAFPLHELGHPELTAAHLLWYFAIVEIIVVSIQGHERELGRLIADGQTTPLLQKPQHMMLAIQSRVMGMVFVKMVMLTGLALMIVPFLSGMALPVAMYWWPVMMVSIILSQIIWMNIGYSLSTIEIYGPYSRSIGWIVNKTIFTLGGLFFPVLFFPDLLQYFVWLTPFPALITATGNFILLSGGTILWLGLLSQVIWVVLSTLYACHRHHKLVQHVMIKGE